MEHSIVTTLWVFKQSGLPAYLFTLFVWGWEVIQSHPLRFKWMVSILKVHSPYNEYCLLYGTSIGLGQLRYPSLSVSVKWPYLKARTSYLKKQKTKNKKNKESKILISFMFSKYCLLHRLFSSLYPLFSVKLCYFDIVSYMFDLISSIFIIVILWFLINIKRKCKYHLWSSSFTGQITSFSFFYHF